MQDVTEAVDITQPPEFWSWLDASKYAGITQNLETCRFTIDTWKIEGKEVHMRRALRATPALRFTVLSGTEEAAACLQALQLSRAQHERLG